MNPVDALNAKVDVLARLLLGRERIREGWVRARPGTFTQRKDGIAPKKGWTVVEALVPPDGADDNAGQLSAWHARFVLLKVIGAVDLVEWSAHPYRTKREVLIAFDKAISLQRGAQHVHGGGWRVSTGPVARRAAA